MKKSKLLTIIIPCYNEEKSLPFFYEKINEMSKRMKYINFEFLFINDGSSDETLTLIKEYSNKDTRIKYISFSRNFGKEAAIYAGLENSKGDYVSLMDADLQDPPELLEEMYNIITNEDYDCVATKRNTRKGEPKIRSFFAKKFYKLINKISKTEMIDGARDYRLMTRQMVDSIISLKEYNRYSKGLFSFVGFKTKWLEYENIERVAGKTKWNFWSLFKYAVEGICAFSTAPLILAIIFGLLFQFVSLILLIIIIVDLIIKVSVSNLLIILCIIFFVSGIQLFTTGIIGEYLSKTYLEVKNRPIYIIKEQKL